MTTSAERMRGWTGPAVLGFGFRPFFLMAGLWAALAMALWIGVLAGGIALPTAFDPVSWHAHEMLFGYLGAVIAGFLLTAVPNWTGRLPVVGWPLAGLAAAWLAGRSAVMVSALLPWGVVMVVDLALPLALGAVLLREIVSGKNWKNLPVLGLLAGWGLANGLYHMDAAQGGYAAQGIGLRLGLAVAVMFISLIGGRIVPSFTRNWLAGRKETRLPVPFGRGDAVVLVISAVALGLWVVWPAQGLVALVCAVAGLAQAWRLSRWQGGRTGTEPLVWVLHVGYGFVPLGFLAVACGPLVDGMAPAAQHVWMAGAVGLMSLAVMTRASLGHAGRPLHAGAPVAALYVAVIVAVFARLLVGVWPEASWLLQLAGAAWIAAFGGFAVIYWPILTQPKAGSRKPPRHIREL